MIHDKWRYIIYVENDIQAPAAATILPKVVFHCSNNTDTAANGVHFSSVNFRIKFGASYTVHRLTLWERRRSSIYTFPERERGSWVRKRTGGSNRDRLGLVFSLFTWPEWLLFIKFLACTGVFREIYMRSILSISRELDWLRNPFLFWFFFFLEIDKISLRIINLTFFFSPKESL